MSPTLEMILRLVATVALIGVNALFVFHEFAFVAIRPRQTRELAREKSPISRLVLKMSNELDHYIAVDQLGITVSSLAVGWIGQPAVSALFEGAFGEMGLSTGVWTLISGGIAFALLTGTQMIVGELMPKSYALRNVDRTARFTARPVEWTAKIFHPFIALMNGIGLGLVRLLGFRGASETHSEGLPVEELMAMTRASARAGMLPADPKALDRLLNFSDLRANDLMIPRMDIVAFSSRMTFDQVMVIAREHEYDRYPVYEGSDDEIVGMVRIKDLLALRVQSKGTQGLRWQRSITSIPTVPETAPIETLLLTMQRSKTPMALLVDEFGTTAGIVTASDISQQLISGPDEIRTEESGSYMIDGHASLALVESELGISLETDHHVDTIAGLFQAETGSIPAEGTRITVNDHVLEVEAMSASRILTIRLTPAQSEPVQEA